MATNPNPVNREDLKQHLADIIRGVLAAERAMRKFECALGANIDTFDTFWDIVLENDFAMLGVIVGDDELDYVLGMIANKHGKGVKRG